METKPIRQATHEARCRAAAVIAHADALLAAHDRVAGYQARLATDERLLTRARVSDHLARRGDAERILADYEAVYGRTDDRAVAPAHEPAASPLAGGLRNTAGAAAPVSCSREVTP